MRAYRGARARWLLTGVVAVVGGAGLAQDAARPVRPPAAPIKLVQDVPPPDLPPSQAPPTTAAPTAPAPAPAPAAAPAGGAVSPSGQQAPRDTGAAAGGTSSTVPVSAATGGAAAGGPSGPAQELGNLLRQSEAAAGVEVQQRNQVSIDPRIRGMRNSQYRTTADGAPFFPARLDLDTPVSKFDPGSVRDVRVIRGPYTTLLGPGLAFLDIATVDTPRNREGNGVRYGGRTSLGYQTNGEQWNGLQAVTAAGRDWGFRGTYNILQGNDYRDGGGNTIPASYLSNNFNYALGYDLTDDSSLEFKGLRVRQENLEFPGLYFDIRQIDTEAYNLRYTARDAGVFNRVTLDTWYNTTVGTGDTRNTAKQQFVNTLLATSFGEARPNTPLAFRDFSDTRFGERSLGYRLAGTWGNNRDEATVTAGHDLNLFGQGLRENIRFRQIGVEDRVVGGTAFPSINVTNNLPLPPGAVGPELTQQQSIPNADSVNPGLFVESLLPVDKRLRVRSGGRADFVRTTSRPRLITGNIDIFGLPQNVAPEPRFVVDPIAYSVHPDRNDLTRDFVLFAGFAAAEYRVTEATTLSLNYGYAERAPTLTELYASGPFIGVLQQGTSRLIGDPNLAKERLNQLDVGLRYDTEAVRAGITGFYAWIHDYITFDANKTSQAGLTQVVFTNTDLATLAGTEMFVQANLTDYLSPFATLSYVQGIDQTHADRRRAANLQSSRRTNPVAREFAVETEPLPQIPPMEARAGMRVHQPRPNPTWQVEFMARMVAGKHDVARSLGELDTPGFTTYNIRGFWQVNRAWLLTAGVENIGDLLYREHLDPVASTILWANGNRNVPPLFRPGTNFYITSQVSY